MSRQPNALRMADSMERGNSSYSRLVGLVAAELRSLRAVNAELLEIARRLVDDGLTTSLVNDARAAIAKATGETK